MVAQPDPLADAFAALPTANTRCPVGRILDDASDIARERLAAALAADEQAVSNSWIMTQLKAAGCRLSKDSIPGHRRGQCRCAAAS